MSDTAILTEYDDGVLLVTLNRPHKRNAFDEAQWDGPRNEPLWAYLSYRPTIGGAENAA